MLGSGQQTTELVHVLQCELETAALDTRSEDALSHADVERLLADPP